MTLIERAWFERDAPVVAPELLNKVLVSRVDGIECQGRIIEVEAYMPDDPASHTFGGQTTRNAVMFGPGGHLYVYLSYGIHQCANVVTGAVGSGQAVLIRAIKPIEGVAAIRERRGGRPERELCNGPGKLCQALAIGAVHNGLDLLNGGTIGIVDDDVAPPKVAVVGPRVGIAKAVEVPWRFSMPERATS